MSNLQKAASKALLCQDACNSSGIARSMVEAMDAIRKAGSHPNQHPVVFLYLYKLMALAGHEPLGLWNEYNTASEACAAIVSAPQAEVVSAQ